MLFGNSSGEETVRDVEDAASRPQKILESSSARAQHDSERALTNFEVCEVIKGWKNNGSAETARCHHGSPLAAVDHNELLF